LASTQENLPSSDAPAELLQPGMTDAIATGLSDEDTVEPPFVQTSSSGPSKKKNGKSFALISCLDSDEIET